MNERKNHLAKKENKNRQVKRKGNMENVEESRSEKRFS